MNGDDIFEEIFGYKPKKRATGYEIIVACVLQYVNSNTAVSHDEKLRAKETKSQYQIDAVIRDHDGEETVVEAKDYKGSVDREVVSKLFGYITALKIKNAIVVTPNGYTKGAVNYPKDVQDQKNIDLYTVRKAKDADYTLPSGSILVKEIRIEACLKGLIYEKGEFKVIHNKEETERISKKMKKVPNSPSSTDNCLYKGDGSEIDKTFMLNEIQKKHDFMKEKYVQGEYIPSEDTYIKLTETENNELVKIDRIEYKIPAYRGEPTHRHISFTIFIKTGTENKDKNYRMISNEAILNAYSNMNK